MTIWIIGLAVGLPFSVWLLADLCAVIDEPHPLPALIRLSLVVSLILLILLLTNQALLYPLLVSFLLISILHAVGFVLALKLGTGVPIFSKQPPRPPLLNDEVGTASMDAK